MALIDVMKRSFKFPFQVDKETGSVPYYKDSDSDQLNHASNVVQQYILTGKDEVLFNGQWGSEVADILFEPDTEYPEDVIEALVHEALEDEERLSLEGAEVERERNEGKTKIQVNYTINSTSTQGIAEVE